MRRIVPVSALAAVLFTSLLAQTPQPSPTQPTQHEQKSQPKCTDSGTYVNRKGETIKRPRTARQRLKELLPDAATEVTASVGAVEGRALIMEALLNGFKAGRSGGRSTSTYRLIPVIRFLWNWGQ